MAWNIDGLWEGREVAVLACGPSMSPAMADSVAHLPRIAVNHAYLLAPDANMLFAHDASWWLSQPLAHRFAGIKACGQPCGLHAVHYCPMAEELVTVAPGVQLQVCNSGLMALRLARAAGASRILAVAFEPERAEPGRYPGLAEGLQSLIAEFSSAGVEVVRHVGH